MRGIMADHQAALRPWLVPRRMPFLGVDGDGAAPAAGAAGAADPGRGGGHGGPATASGTPARSRRSCSPTPAAGISDVAEVFAVIAQLADSHRLAWQVDVAPQDLWPERSVRALLARVTDDGVRGPAEKALDELDRRQRGAGRRGRRRGAGGRVRWPALRRRSPGCPAPRPPAGPANSTPAGRSPTRSACAPTPSGWARTSSTASGTPLALVLDSARWFMAEVRRRCTRSTSRRPTGSEPPRSAATSCRSPTSGCSSTRRCSACRRSSSSRRCASCDERWSAILDLPPDARQVQLRSADLRERAASAFPARPLPWPMAVHHSPDLMIAGADAAAGGQLTWVLGEVHPSIVTIALRHLAGVPRRPGGRSGRHAARPAAGPAVWFAEIRREGGTSTRLSNVLPSPGDLRLVFAHDSCGYDPADDRDGRRVRCDRHRRRTAGAAPRRDLRARPARGRRRPVAHGDGAVLRAGRPPARTGRGSRSTTWW